VNERNGAPAAQPAMREKPHVWRWLPHPFMTLALGGVWLMLNNTLHPRHVLIGAVLGFAIPLFAQHFLPEAPRIRSWRAVGRFLPLFLWDVVVANFVVAGLILNFRRRVRPTWVAVPLDLADPYAITTLANVISLTPGTVSSQLDAQRRTLLVHVLDTADPAAEVARIKTRYERPIREIFEC
jgi:multicomponent K+:H+ antiporter subunit E